MNYRCFHKKYMKTMCRSCLNKTMGLHLRSIECNHNDYPTTCTRCGDMRHVIIGIKPRARWKIFFYRERRQPTPEK